MPAGHRSGRPLRARPPEGPSHELHSCVSADVDTMSAAARDGPNWGVRGAAPAVHCGRPRRGAGNRTQYSAAGGPLCYSRIQQCNAHKCEIKRRRAAAGSTRGKPGRSAWAPQRRQCPPHSRPTAITCARQRKWGGADSIDLHVSKDPPDKRQGAKVPDGAAHHAKACKQQQQQMGGGRQSQWGLGAAGGRRGHTPHGGAAAAAATHLGRT